jgi:endonuclease/exonuclease/phosphatase family metal-dependent hydrolase
VLKVVSINILFELDYWQQRRDLLVAGLAAEQADLIGVQEINLQAETGQWLAEQIGMPYLYQVPFQKRAYDKGPDYGVAIFSKYPFVWRSQLDLQSQGRFAQAVQIEINQRLIGFCNGHYFWQPGTSAERLQQFKLLLNWLDELPPELPVIAVGDFNATPDTPEIALMCDRFTSAYAAAHGQEPDYTCPTPLIKRQSSLFRKVAYRLRSAWANRSFKPWRGTLDYIFINQHLTVYDCRIILNQPAPNHPEIYPSDHFGMSANLKLV